MTSETTGGTGSSSKRPSPAIPPRTILATDGAGRAPPEDVGGIPASKSSSKPADTRSEQHDELTRWDHFDPERLDEGKIHDRIGKLAKRRAFGKSRNRIN